MNLAPSISFEFFPPKDNVGEERLWTTLELLKPIKPDFVSVTYGAAGSTRDRTIRITSEIMDRANFEVVAHLTCVGSTKTELIDILNKYKTAGIKQVLALRGDPVGGPRSNWISTPDGFDHADQLVELAKTMGFKVGVAAFPDGHPASAGNLDQDLNVLVKKAKLGATFATTQFFFDANKWKQLVLDLAKKNVNIPVIPGILPITNIKKLNRMAELTGTPIPDSVLKRIESVSEIDVSKVGIEIATEFCEQLLKLGAPGLHFYTMNNSGATFQIVQNLNIAK